MGDVNGPIDLMGVAMFGDRGPGGYSKAWNEPASTDLHVSDSTNETRNRGPPRHSSVA